MVEVTDETALSTPGLCQAVGYVGYRKQITTVTFKSGQYVCNTYVI